MLIAGFGADMPVLPPSATPPPCVFHLGRPCGGHSLPQSQPQPDLAVCVPAVAVAMICYYCLPWMGASTMFAVGRGAAARSRSRCGHNTTPVHRLLCEPLGHLFLIWPPTVAAVSKRIATHSGTSLNRAPAQPPPLPPKLAPPSASHLAAHFSDSN